MTRLEAVDKSIEHWKENKKKAMAKKMALSLRDIGGAECALCKYCESEQDSYDDDMCGYCPIATHTVTRACKNTPWYKIRDAIAHCNRQNIITGCSEMLALLREIRKLVAAGKL